MFRVANVARVLVFGGVCSSLLLFAHIAEASLANIGVNKAPAILQTLDSVGNVGGDPSIAIGSDGLPIIAYTDITNTSVKFARCRNLSCSQVDISTLVSGDIAGATYPSVAIDSDGLPMISYSGTYNISVNVVRLIRCGNVSCTSTSSTVVDTNSSQKQVLAIGSDGLPVIAIDDSMNADLRLLKCANISCTSTSSVVIDSSGNVGESPSMVIGRDGYPVISYYDNSNTAMKFVKCNDYSCSSNTIRTIESTGTVGTNSSIAIGSDGYPVITYHDETNIFDKILKFAKCTDESCSSSAIQSVANIGILPIGTATAIGQGGLPIIIFTYSVSENLGIIFCQNTSCSTNSQKIITTPGSDGLFPSVAISNNGYLFIAFAGGLLDNDLKFAYVGAQVKVKSSAGSGKAPTPVTLDSTGMWEGKALLP